MKKFWKYLNHSNIKFAFDLNPFVWSFRYMHEGPTKSDPNLYIWYIRFFPISFILTIDDGSYIIIDDLENLELVDKEL